MEENKNQLNIELNEETAEGVYSNLAIISHSNAEFILDFIRIMPGVPKAKVKSRVVMSPIHAKRLMLALQDNVQKFEQQFGKINMDDDNQTAHPFPMNFSGPQGDA